MKTTICHPEVGEINLYIRKGMSRTIFSVSENGVKITTSQDEISTIFPLTKERIQWILSAKQKIENKPKKHIVFNQNTILKTNKFTVIFKENNLIKSSFTAKYKYGIIEINYLPEIDFSTKQDVIRNIVSHFLKQEAKNFLPKRLHELAEKYDFSYQSVKINSARKRWGSCYFTSIYYRFTSSRY